MSAIPIESQKPVSSWKFSPLRVLGFVSLLLGVKGQMPFPAEIELSKLDGLNGFVLDGEALHDASGYWVSSAGDINADGIDDFAIGAHGRDPGGRINAGQVYVMFGRAQLGRRGQFDLRGLDKRDGFIIVGDETGDLSGYAIANAGDVNGDSISDLIVSSYRLSSPPTVGKIHVIFGRKDIGAAGPLKLAELSGTTGFVFHANEIEGKSKFSLAGAGDVNADGIGDLLIGAEKANTLLGGGASGKTYVIFGNAKLGSSGAFNLSQLQNSEGFTLSGERGLDSSGFSVAGIGDLNADDIDDFAVGAFRADIAGKVDVGKVYVLFGKQGLSQGKLINLDGITGFVIYGERQSDYNGVSVSGAGDVNGDGIKDLVIGAHEWDAPNRTNTGATYVIFGSEQVGGRGIIRLAELDGSEGFALRGVNASDRAGRSVAGAGDVNGDGFDDLLIGAYFSSPYGRREAGRAFVVFGQTDIGRNGVVELATLNGTNGFAANGQPGAPWTGLTVAGAGDVNADGAADVLIGSYRVRGEAGKTYVVFGRNLYPTTTRTTTPAASTTATLRRNPTALWPASSEESNGVVTALVLVIVGLLLSMGGGVGYFFYHRWKEGQDASGKEGDSLHSVPSIHPQREVEQATEAQGPRYLTPSLKRGLSTEGAYDQWSVIEEENAKY